MYQMQTAAYPMLTITHITLYDTYCTLLFTASYISQLITLSKTYFHIVHYKTVFILQLTTLYNTCYSSQYLICCDIHTLIHTIHQIPLYFHATPFVTLHDTCCSMIRTASYILQYASHLVSSSEHSYTLYITKCIK